MRKGINPVFEDILDYWKDYDESHKYIKKFLKKIKIDKDTGCWIFTGTIRKMKNGKPGYGSATLLRRTNGAHKFSFRIFRGKVKKGLFVCHACDNPPCCNPYHLFLGTPNDNTQDMINKGRQVDPKTISEKLKGKVNIGDKNGMNLHPERRATKENGRHISVKNPNYSNNQGDKHWSHKNKEKMLELRRRVKKIGSEHGQAKMDEAKVLEIKKGFILFPNKTNNEIARKYGVSDGAISHIRHGRSWTHVKLSKKWLKKYKNFI